MTHKRRCGDLSMIKHTAILLPNDILVKIVFFIEDFMDVATFLDALRPAKILGPLEHLWSLHFEFEWPEVDLWPCLSVFEMTSASSVHAKYYAQVTVHNKTDLAWAHRPLARMDISSYHITGALPFLEDIYRWNCSLKSAEAVFEYAASSLYLREVGLRKECDSRGINSSVITALMGENIIKWSQSRPIQIFRLKEFTWESPDLRRRSFLFYDFGAIGGATFNRQSKSLAFKFPNIPHQIDDERIDEDFIELFQPLIEAKVKHLSLIFLRAVDFAAVWKILKPSLQLCHLEKLSLVYCKLTGSDLTQIVQTIHEVETIAALDILGTDCISANGVESVLISAPPSLKKLGIPLDHSCQSDELTQEEIQKLQDLANDRNIHLVNTSGESPYVW
ncbi:hypothetical protein AeMF1_021380 [Aphanomyces euteiches]|nr:hypothetical protein AeMF1_021380 [Aphanomyces euteiches]KAH9193974.1 hypothetical protein AeNC1_004054 [Aphanomyces euteiches]